MVSKKLEAQDATTWRRVCTLANHPCRCVIDFCYVGKGRDKIYSRYLSIRLRGWFQHDVAWFYPHYWSL